MVNSQAKGYRGEVLWQAFMSKLGIKSERVKRKQGGRDGGACDVVSDAKQMRCVRIVSDEHVKAAIIPLPTIHWEVKNTKTLPPKGVRNALMQARATANGGPCAVAMHIEGTSHFGIYFETSDWELSDFGLQPTGESSK